MFKMLSHRKYRVTLTILALLASLVALFTMVYPERPEIEKSAFCPKCRNLSQKPLPLEKTSNGRTFALKLRIPTWPASHFPRVGFVLATYGKTFEIREATLTLSDSTGKNICLFREEENLIRDNAEFKLKAQGNCDSNPANFVAILNVDSMTDGDLAMWAKGPVPPADLEALSPSFSIEDANSANPATYLPLGFTYGNVSGVHKPIAERLAFMWSTGSWIVFFGIASFLMALILLVLHFLVSKRTLPSPLLIGLAAFFLGACYSILIPPFQAPDEPDHALTMAVAMQSNTLTHEFENLAKKTHLERIKFHPEEKFLTRDMEKPAAVPWGEHVAATELSRSGFSTLLWAALAKPVSQLSGSGALLIMRLLQSAMFGLAATVGATLLGPRFNFPSALSIFLIPTVAMFAMHLSNYGPLVSFTVIFASALTALLWGKKRPWIGFALGASIALLMATSRSVWVFLPAMASALLLGALTKEPNESHRQKLFFWGSLSAGLCFFWLFSTPDYLDLALYTIHARLPSQLGNVASVILKTPVTVVLIFFVLFGIDHLCAKLPKLGAEKKQLIVKPAVLMAFIFLAFSYLLPLVRPELAVPDIETGSKIPLIHYLKKSIVLCAALFRWGAHDFYMITSFYGGFGWLETLLPSWVISVILAIAAGGLVVTLLHIRKNGNLNVLLKLIFIFVALLASVALSAKGNWDESVNLHGRYLIPFHLTLITICCSGYALIWPKEPNEKQKEGLYKALFAQVLLMGMLVMIQTFSLVFVLTRYF